MNHYQTLQVSARASQQEIKQAYRRLAKRFHPDSQTEANCDKIVALNAAYEVLGNIQNRRIYDRQLQLNSVDDSSHRQQRSARAHQQYRRYRQAQQASDFNYQLWLEQIYFPIDRLALEILQSLGAEIDELAADPFDDELMENFIAYLETCRSNLQLARQTLESQPNPSQLAGVAVHIYYCLDRIGDGIKELEWFTFNYDYHSLHMGQEIFRIASKLRDRARDEIN
ncbi:J domain-containing protein [Myxosarcina sp. GI1(2024)]